jgi:tRNA(adenine34) deaminase
MSIGTDGESLKPRTTKLILGFRSLTIKPLSDPRTYRPTPVIECELSEFSVASVRGEMESHETYMREALIEAEQGALEGEVPVGAILVAPSGDIIARAHNRPISLSDPTGHAEILVLRQGAAQLENYRLSGHLVYVSLEPCVMCVGAMIQARLAMVVYGAADSKSGAIQSVYRMGTDGKLNHRLEFQGGVLAEECKSLLQAFFRAKR